jgi:hypothetical protein
LSVFILVVDNNDVFLCKGERTLILFTYVESHGVVVVVVEGMLWFACLYELLASTASR